jgi:hypothetical protein
MLPEFCKCRVYCNRRVQGVNLMKNYIAAIITIIFLICPSICFSSYLIELKNGSTFITNHYWKDGRQIKFYYYGGVVGVEKEFVREIRESDLPYKEEVVKQVTSQTTKMPDKELYPETDTTNEDIDVAFYKNAKKDLMDKYLKTRQRLKQARTTRDKAGIRKSKKEIKGLEKEISDLAIKLKKENRGVLPPWWFRVGGQEQQVETLESG